MLLLPGAPQKICYFTATKARFEELRCETYNSEVNDPGPDGQPPARLTLGIESADGMSAAQYCTLWHECYPLPKDDAVRGGQIAEIVKFLQKEGKCGANQMALAVAVFGTTFSDNTAVQKQTEALMKELAQYDRPGLDEARQQKPKHKEFQER